VKEKKDELQKKAVKRAAEVALDQSAKAAKGIVKGAGKALGHALFGDERDAHEGVAASAPEAPPDPFAKLKAAERERAAAEQRERAGEAAAVEQDVDAELAALKKRLGR
jgi:hypothetical protein